MSDELHAEYREGRGDVGAERFWEGHYSRRERVWSGRPNPILVDIVGGLRPGTALDLGCGEGGDAIWLARRGWRVTAVDVSATALDRAAVDAAKAGIADRIEFRRHDLALSFPRAPSTLSRPSTCIRRSSSPASACCKRRRAPWPPAASY